MKRSAQKQRKTEQISRVVETIGRPINEPIEDIFMKKLRDGKLQVITSESEVQILCAQFSDSKNQILTKSTSRSDKSQVNYSQEKIYLIREWFRRKQSQNADYIECLWRAFKSAVQSFEFRQIPSIDNIPRYLFLDQCDLTYILYHILNHPIQGLENKSSFSSSELFYLQMLCLGYSVINSRTRDVIPFRVLRCLQEYHEQIIESMNGLKQKIEQQYRSMKKSKIKVDQRDSSQQLKKKDTKTVEQHHEQLPTQLRKGQYLALVPSEEEFKQIADSLKKKHIHKDKKQREKKSAGRPKTKKEKHQEKMSTQNVEQLVRKLISHISWSYLYIYPEELRKNELISSSFLS